MYNQEQYRDQILLEYIFYSLELCCGRNLPDWVSVQFSFYIYFESRFIVNHNDFVQINVYWQIKVWKKNNCFSAIVNIHAMLYRVCIIPCKSRMFWSCCLCALLTRQSSKLTHSSTTVQLEARFNLYFYGLINVVFPHKTTLVAFISMHKWISQTFGKQS